MCVGVCTIQDILFLLLSFVAFQKHLAGPGRNLDAGLAKVLDLSQQGNSKARETKVDSLVPGKLKGEAELKSRLSQVCSPHNIFH